MWDVFISHAWEDKETVARPLAHALSQAGLSVWYDELTLTLGDGLRRSIDRGLAESRYGVVILSPQFFAKSWPQRELDGLTTREIIEFRIKNGTVCGILGVCDHKELHSNYKSGVNAPSSC